MTIRIKVSELREKLEQKESSIKLDEMEKIEQEIESLQKKLSELNVKYEKELKLKYILRHEYYNMDKKRVFAKAELIEEVEKLLKLSPETVLKFMEENDYHINSWNWQVK